MQVRSCAAKSRAVSNRNCGGAIRGGEQRNENDQSVTQIAHVGGRRELDSVGVTGRACERKAKPVTAGLNPLAAGRSPVGALMVGDGMVGSSPAVTRETRRGKRCSRPGGPKSRPTGVRASVVALKRVTTVERRDVGKWLRKALAGRPKTDANGGNASISRCRPRPMRAGWHVGSGLSAGGRNSPRVSRQTVGVCAAWAAVLGGGTRLVVGHRMITHPLTGEPDAGDPPVRFGGRGWVQSLVPTSIRREMSVLCADWRVEIGQYHPPT